MNLLIFIKTKIICSPIVITLSSHRLIILYRLRIISNCNWLLTIMIMKNKQSGIIIWDLKQESRITFNWPLSIIVKPWK
jgi:hypothetical protein